MEQMLCKVFADFKVFSNKVHVLHTCMCGELFLQYHSFLWEVYEYLEDNIDGIMEDMVQLKYSVPYSLDELLEESDIVELTKTEKDISKQILIVGEDLKYMISNLQKGIELSGEKKDFVIQNNLIDLQKQLRIFERKNRSSFNC